MSERNGVVCCRKDGKRVWVERRRGGFVSLSILLLVFITTPFLVLQYLSLVLFIPDTPT